MKQRSPNLLVECLTPDFRGDQSLVSIVANSGLDVFAHNIETVERLQRKVRDYRAGYQQSLAVLQGAKESFARVNSSHDKNRVPLITKTSLMLGVGETIEDIRKTLIDLRHHEVDVVTFGQYLRPSRRHLSVQRYVTPEEFQDWQQEAEGMGFKYVASGPLVRSSYKVGITHAYITKYPSGNHSEVIYILYCVCTTRYIHYVFHVSLVCIPSSLYPRSCLIDLFLPSSPQINEQ